MKLLWSGSGKAWYNGQKPDNLTRAVQNKILCIRKRGWRLNVRIIGECLTE